MHFGEKPVCGFEHWYGDVNTDYSKVECKDCLSFLHNQFQVIADKVKKNRDKWYRDSIKDPDLIIRYKSKIYRWDNDGSYGVAVLKDMNTGDIFTPSVYDLHFGTKQNYHVMGRIFKP